ncbi:MAG: chromosomal replication initiator DnaA [Pseudomonadota bacterium]
MSAGQLTFEWPADPNMTRARFLQAPSNAAALAAVDAWPDWPSAKLIICGEAGLGKSHLAHIWARRAQAVRATPDHLPQDVGASVVVEDLHSLTHLAAPARHAAERALFHLHNRVLENGHSLLLTGRGRPDTWGVALPDLASRLTATPLVQLGPPEDSLLSGLLVKLFADRQLRVTPELIAWLVKRMDRSGSAAGEVVERLDAEALRAGKNVSRTLAISVFGG